MSGSERIVILTCRRLKAPSYLHAPASTRNALVVSISDMKTMCEVPHEARAT